MDKAEYMVLSTAVDRNSRTLRRREGAHYFIQVGFHSQGVHVRPRHHNFPHLDLCEFDGAEDEFLFAGGEQSALARLLNLNLQLFCGMRNAVSGGVSCRSA